ncbi:lytic transglycosylase domain-containing protein [Sphingomonas sp.]|uniref:lytic transglycosylase domain-containing protein n=1 Tax=Sphingomonas sp. TaxID=28214 RepID=UPI0025E0D139|nr:lytic transglycosylase domain-containing protein [Sphingomonas sp.]
MPCPLTAPLRVPDGASVAGLRTLSQCSAILVAPATPGEVAPLEDRRISPEAPTLRRSSGARLAAVGGGVPVPAEPAAKGPMRVAAIAPTKPEPVDLGAALGPVSGESILAMRPVSYTTRYDAMISRVAARHRIDPLLLHAVIDQESRYQANATSPAGARGLMQLMPSTARTLNVPGAAIADAEANVDGGARLLRHLHGRFNDFNLTLAAYNAGEGAVRKYGNQVPPYPETQNYVRSVMTRYERLVAEQASGSR